MGKKVLFVGDLREAFNYGAMATSDALMSILKTKVKEEDIKYITHRSFMGETPKHGHLTHAALYKGFNIKDFRPSTTLHVPSKLKFYEEFSKEVLTGKKLQYEFELIKWANVVYINSEGNIVKGTTSDGTYRVGGLYVLFMAYFSKVIMNKETYIVNHTVDPQNEDVKEIIKYIYPLLDGVYVRENMSVNLLNEWGVTNALMVADALFNYKVKDNRNFNNSKISKEIDFSKPYICLGDSSGIKSLYSSVSWDVCEVYSQLVEKLKHICPQIVLIDGFSGNNHDIIKVQEKYNLGRIGLDKFDYHDLYNVLSQSEIFISGRWHASILALLSKTPILLWGADSHKTKALYDLINYPYRFFDINNLPNMLDEVILEVDNILRNGLSKDVLVKIEELKRSSLKNVDMF